MAQDGKDDNNLDFTAVGAAWVAELVVVAMVGREVQVELQTAGGAGGGG